MVRSGDNRVECLYIPDKTLIGTYNAGQNGCGRPFVCLLLLLFLFRPVVRRRVGPSTMARIPREMTERMPLKSHQIVRYRNVLNSSYDFVYLFIFCLGVTEKLLAWKRRRHRNGV